MAASKKTAPPKITKAMRTFAAKIVAPEGFTREERDDHYSNGQQYDGWHKMLGTLTVMLKSDDVVITFAIEDTVDWASKKKALRYNGHTNFKTEKGWRSFDRLGVEDSFYSPWNSKELPDPATVIAEQLERIVKAKAADAERVDIPGLPYRINEAGRKERSQALKTRGCTTFTPSGFGTGHTVTTKKTRYGKPLPKATADFFGVQALYVETFDHD